MTDKDLKELSAAEFEKDIECGSCRDWYYKNEEKADMFVLQLKIGRNSYDITTEDTFMNNGSCIQLMTQSKEKLEWGRRCSPVLSKKAEKEISQYEKVLMPHNYQDKSIQVYSLNQKK